MTTTTTGTKRVRVSAGLHAELTEHTNLVRVLRTRRALDLTAHLLAHRDDADVWTAWPLIDCPVPEWSLEDEINHLADAVVQQHRERDDDGGEQDASDSESGSDLGTLSPTAARRLVLHTGAVLVHVLNLMADQRPSAPGCMQNRLAPMNWEDVISLLAVSGVLDPSVVDRAEKRLERIYGPSNTRAMERLEAVASAKARFATLGSVGEDQLLAPPMFHPRACRSDAQGRRSLKSGVKSRAIIDTDTE